MAPSGQLPDPSEDIVGDRLRLVNIGMGAVFVAGVIFGALRLVTELSTGRETPWWGNLVCALLIALLWIWFRRAPATRSELAVHGTALIATVALVIPAAYGMTSSKWWLALVGFSVLLMGRRREAVVWAVATIVLVPAVALLEPSLAVENAAGESPAERAMAGLVFVCLLLAVTAAFRQVALHRARELTETAASLARANAVKTRFLAHMSHEVRTPLHSVIAMTDLAQSGDASPVVQDQLRTARQSAEVLLDLLNNILDVTRVEAGALELDARPFSLADALGEALRPLVAQAAAKGVALTARAAPGIPGRRIGDRVRVTQIVLNLVGNAVKFTEQGAVHVQLTAADPARLRLEVKDTGPGIAPDKLGAIFEPFVQAHARDARLQGGAGLGLAIVRELVLAMDGRTEVRSEVGKGSTFLVELRLPADAGDNPDCPEDLAVAPAPIVLREATPPPRPLRILVCEDHPVNLKLLLAMLSRLGHHPTVTQDGLAAWELVQRESFDLLLTDIELPGIDGVELARRIREREGAASLPRLRIIGATAHVGEAERHRLLEAGMDDHLGKPFTLAELRALLST